MKRGLLALAICALPLVAHAIELPELIRSAEAVNETYRALVIEADLAELRYDKARIEASDRIQELNADIAWLTARVDERRSLQAFYGEVVDAVYGAVAADYDRRIAEWNDRLARDQEAVVEVQFRNGLVPESELFDARIAVRSAAVDREERAWQLVDALDALSDATGLTLDEVSLPPVPAFAIRMSLDDWIADDLSVARARLAEQIVELRVARMPANAARFDRITLETELERAQLATERAVSASQRTYETLRRRLTTLPEIIVIRTEQLRISEASHREAQERFNRGLITAAQRDQTWVRVLTARRNLVDSERNYMRTILEYAAAAGILLEEIL